MNKKTSDGTDTALQRHETLAEVMKGLANSQKELPCKLLYDARGSSLFVEITKQPEYYTTRTEIAILQSNAADMAGEIGEEAALIEYGSGSSEKVRILLDAMTKPAAYLPIDISKEHLNGFASMMREQYPSLQVAPAVADYTKDFQLPQLNTNVNRRVVLFSGSTIGNFSRDEAKDFLRRTLKVCGKDGLIVVGVDLRKDPLVLHRAYNDSAGTTAEFNLNLLRRLNRDIGADFDMGKFRHYAFYNIPYGRVEMHLVSLESQDVRINGSTISFQKGESIWTESSYKYSLKGFAELAAEIGGRVVRVWTDPDRLFSVQFIKPA